MSIIDTWIEKKLTTLGVKLGTLPAQWGAVPLAQAGGNAYMDNPSARMTGQAMYNTLSWINAAISIPANVAAPVKLEVEREGVTNEENEAIANHPFEKLIKHPNPLMSRSEFMTSTYSYYQAAGNSYWWVNAPGMWDDYSRLPPPDFVDPRNPPDEMWIINPADIAPIPDSKLFISHYEYNAPNGKVLKIPHQQIVHFKKWNPANPFMGISACETLIYQANADLGRIRNDEAVYTRGNGTPPGILAFADNFIPSEWEKMKMDFDEGSRSMRRFLMLRNVKQGGVQWLQNQLSNRDQQVLESRQFTREEIFTVLAPGLASMLAINATEANSKTGKATLMEFVIYPMLCMVAEKITSDLMPRYGENLEAEFEEVRTKDRVLELQEIAAYSLTHTLAEIRKTYYSDEPLGDDRDGLLPSQVTAASGAPAPEPQPAPMDTQPADSNAPDNMAANNMEDDSALMAEMKRWKRVARKAIEKGQPIREFVTTIIPAGMQATIKAQLATVKSVEELDAAFDVLPQVEADPLVTELRRANDLLEELAHAG